MTENVAASLDPTHFTLWLPADGRKVSVGAEQLPYALPRLPLPIHPVDLAEGDPSDPAVGQGVYDYLRQFPDCDLNRDYAFLLRDAYPHFLSDLGAQILMLDHKEVDSQYVRRKICYMKILVLLDEQNLGLLQRLGIEYFHLSQMFDEFIHTRQHLLQAMRYLHRVFKGQPDNVSALNCLAQIDYLFGDYPSALARWRQVVDLLPEGDARQTLSARVADLSGKEPPSAPLVDDCEHIGIAMDLYGRGEIAEATTTLEIIEERGHFTSEYASPEFFYFLGICRGQNGDAAGAFEALEKSLQLNPEFAPAVEAMNRFLDTGNV